MYIDSTHYPHYKLTNLLNKSTWQINANNMNMPLYIYHLMNMYSINNSSTINLYSIDNTSKAHKSLRRAERPLRKSTLRESNTFIADHIGMSRLYCFIYI